MPICSLCSGSGRDIVTPASRSCPKCLGSGQEFGSTGPSGGSRGGGSTVELGPFGKKFLGFGLILLGLRLSPGLDAAGSAWIIPGGLLALGALGLTKGMRESWGEGWYPFEETVGRRGAVLRFLWAFRPRSWLIAWVMIIGGVVIWGSPHALYAWENSYCYYAGLNGTETFRSYEDCPRVKVFPLR